MPTAVSAMTNVSADDRARALRFAASFLWADLEIADAERRFLTNLASELGADRDELDELLECPPIPEQVDPNAITLGGAALIRDVALRAIASDGAVTEEEMAMFELLDDLLPR